MNYKIIQIKIRIKLEFKKLEESYTIFYLYNISIAILYISVTFFSLKYLSSFTYLKKGNFLYGKYFLTILNIFEEFTC